VPSAPRRFDPLPLLEALSDAGVDFVVIGGVAGGAHGSARATFDLDVAYARDRENLERLATALGDLQATLRGAPSGLPFLLDATTLASGNHFTFSTPLGPLDILADPDGAPRYAELRAGAVRATIGGREALVASLDHLIAMKEASGRAQDRLDAAEYRTIADMQREPNV